MNRIKGAQKQMIVLRTGSSRYFDEALFVIRRGIDPLRTERSDMLIEANRILRESTFGRQTCRRSGGARRLLWFLAGLLCGAAGGVLLFLLLR